ELLCRGPRPQAPLGDGGREALLRGSTPGATAFPGGRGAKRSFATGIPKLRLGTRCHEVFYRSVPNTSPKVPRLVARRAKSRRLRGGCQGERGTAQALSPPKVNYSDHNARRSHARLSIRKETGPPLAGKDLSHGNGGSHNSSHTSDHFAPYSSC